MLTKVLPKIRTAFEKGGWHSNRNIDLSASLSAYKCLGLPEVTESVRILLMEFNGIKIETYERNIEFDVLASINWLDEDVSYIDKILNAPLWPFGYGDRVYYLLGSSGDMVLLHDEWSGYYHFSSFEVALNFSFEYWNMDHIPLRNEQRPIHYRSY